MNQICWTSRVEQGEIIVQLAFPPLQIRTWGFPSYGFPTGFTSGFHKCKIALICYLFDHSVKFPQVEQSLVHVLAYFIQHCRPMFSNQKHTWSNAPLLLPVLPFRVSSLIWASPTPSPALDISRVRVSHVHAQPLADTQHHLTPSSPRCALYRFFQQGDRFHHLWELDHY